MAVGSDLDSVRAGMSSGGGLVGAFPCRSAGLAGNGCDRRHGRPARRARLDPGLAQHGRCHRRTLGPAASRELCAAALRRRAPPAAGACPAPRSCPDGRSPRHPPGPLGSPPGGASSGTGPTPALLGEIFGTIFGEIFGSPRARPENFWNARAREPTLPRHAVGGPPKRRSTRALSMSTRRWWLRSELSQGVVAAGTLEVQWHPPREKYRKTRLQEWRPNGS